MSGTRGLAVAGGCLAIGVLVAWGVQTHTAALRHGNVAHLAAAAPAGGSALRTSTLWILSIGVSRYEDPEFNLQFADTDARALAAAFEHQLEGPLYRDVKTLVLVNEQVTRDSILGNMESFLGHAGADDVVVIFVAGHGVQDPNSGSYYFLPSTANAANLVTAGLRMPDFDEMVRVLRRNVRAVVLILDTCHAGALHVSGSALLPASDSGMRLSTGEGFFLLAASKPGEDSKERSELAHGALTYALLQALQGAADGDGDGLLPISDLFGYVAREVPRLTDGTQHPYHKIEGTDLVLAAVPKSASGEGMRAQVPRAQVPPAPAPNHTPQPVTPPANTIGVVEFRDLRAAPEHDWIGKAVRVALNTELSKVRALRVYSPELIDRSTNTQRSNYLEAAQRLGIRKLLTGSFHVVGTTVRIDADIVDTTTGLQEGSDSVQGNLDAFFDLQKQLVLSMLRRLPVEVSQAENQSIHSTTNTSVNAYRLMLESEGLVEESKPPAFTPQAGPVPQQPESRRSGIVNRFAARLLSCAYAADEPAASSADVRRVLEDYRTALQEKDLDRLVALYVSFSARQREALRAYLENALDLAVEFTDVQIDSRAQEIAVSYTRRDHFIDKASSKPQGLEVRLTKIMVRDNGQWKIKGGP